MGRLYFLYHILRWQTEAPRQFVVVFLSSAYRDPLGGETVLSFHMKEKYHKSRETLNVLKAALRWSNSKKTVQWKENFLSNLISFSSGCVFLFLKRDALVITTDFGQQSYCTVELARVQVEAASISLKWPLLSVGRPSHHSRFLRAWARSRYSVYILGGSVCAPKPFNGLHFKLL